MIISTDDLNDADIDWVLNSAAAAARGTLADAPRSCVVGLLFMTPSLRTRLGFAVAAAALGGSAIDVRELRWGPGMSDAESFADTLRTMSGMVDVVVARTPEPLDRALVVDACVSAFINAGDGAAEHPTQALIDLCAIVEERGPVGELRIGISGDLTSRCARSLISLLARRPPCELALIAPPERDHLAPAAGAALGSRVSWRKAGDVEDLDVLYLPGLPAGRGDSWLAPEARIDYAVTPATLDRMRADAVVLSPLPVIDEVAADARRDPRIRMFEQSDRGVHVRTALLALALRSQCVTATGSAA